MDTNCKSEAIDGHSSCTVLLSSMVWIGSTNTSFVYFFTVCELFVASVSVEVVFVIAAKESSKSFCKRICMPDKTIRDQ